MFGVCKKCGKVRFIVNKTKFLCDECNYCRLHSGKTRKEVAISKINFKNKRYRKNTGELALFKEIWNERQHVCARCGQILPEPMRVHYFSHIKSKGAFPELRLCKTNIELLCINCHQKYEFGR